MTLIEKLEKEIAEGEAALASLENMPSLFTLHTGTMAGLNMALDIVKQHSAWVPCSERLPDNDGEYLVFVRNDFLGYQFVAIFTTDTGARWSIKNVTHWAELPQPPSEVQT